MEVEKDDQPPENHASIQTMNNVAQVVGNWISPIIYPQSQDNCHSTNWKFTTMSWKVVAKAHDLELMTYKVSFNSLIHVSDKNTKLWKSISSMLSIKFLKEVAIPRTNAKLQSTRNLLAVLNTWRVFFHSILWECLWKKKLMVIISYSILPWCSRLNQQIHIQTSLWGHSASSPLHQSTTTTTHWSFSKYLPSDWCHQWTIHSKLCSRLDLLYWQKIDWLVEQILSMLNVCSKEATSTCE